MKIDRMRGVSLAVMAAVGLGLSACATTGDDSTDTNGSSDRAERAPLATGLDASANRDPFPSTYRGLPRENMAIVGGTVFDGAGRRFENGVVVITDGRVVAVGTALSGEVNLRNMRVAAGQIMGFYGPLHCWKVLWSGLQMERIVLPPPKRTFYLAHLGVNRASTGQGIGTQLIDYLLQQGRDAGFSITALDVSAGNPLAQRLYERLGFVVQIERASHLPGIAAHRYLQRPL